MLASKDFQICVDALKTVEQTKEVTRVIKKLELVMKAEEVKKESEDVMIEINNELRKIFEEENEVK